MAAAVQLNTAQIKLALEHDAEFFIQFFLEDELTFPVPQFHIDIFSLMIRQDIDAFVCAIPRDHAKTTLAKLACVWYFLFTDYRFIVYLSNTATIAIPAVNDVAAFMRTENFITVFGEPEWLVEQEGVGFYKFKLQGKLCILRAMGAGQQVRGINVDNQRPQLAIVDDLEDNDNIATEPLFRKLKVWFYGPFKKCLDKFNNKIIHLGNMISLKSLLHEHCESKFWYSRRYGCLLANSKALWEDAWPIEKLKRDFAEYQSMGMADIWFAEMMNLPMAAGKGLIQADEITYKPAVMPGDQEFAFITIDLAISDATWAHETVIAVHGWVNEHWQIVDIIGFKGIDPIALFHETMVMAARWNLRVIGIESVAYQASLQSVFPHLCLINHIPNMKFIPLPAVQRKVQRLAPWAGMLKPGEWALTEGDFHCTQQLLNFDPTKKNNEDDYIDCCAHGPYVAQNFMYEIQADIDSIDTTSGCQTAYQVARI
jgi:hypothetical protein